MEVSGPFHALAALPLKNHVVRENLPEFHFILNSPHVVYHRIEPRPPYRDTSDCLSCVILQIEAYAVLSYRRLGGPPGLVRMS